MPPDITAALRRLQGGVGTDADRQIVAQFADANKNTLPAEDLMTLRLAVTTPAFEPTGPLAASQTPGYTDPGHLPSSLPNEAFGGFGRPRGFTEDWRAQAASVSAPTPPAVDPTDMGGTPNMDFALPFMRRVAEGVFRPGVEPAPALGTQNPTGPLTEGPANYNPPKQFPSEGFQKEQWMRGAREHRRPGDQRDKEDWRLQQSRFGLDPESAFYGTSRQAAGLFANDPYLAALQMSRSEEMPQGDINAATANANQMQAAIELSRMGALSGHRRKGLGSGPSASAGQLSQAEGFLDDFGPGQFVDPAWTYNEAFRRAQRTPAEKFSTGEGPTGDLREQLEVTNTALLMSSAAFMEEGAADRLSKQLELAGMQWLMAKAQGEAMTYPQYLKSIGAAKWVRSGI